MDHFWSEFVQTTEELYFSRAVRFREDNAQLWLDHIGVQPGQKILELGCGGGLFCHRIKKAVPSVQITGSDFDEGHIAWAKRKTLELGLDCEFISCDATSVPFPDETFDLCYSHTVAEHIPHEPFFAEQKRLLKPGGRICLMGVFPRLNLRRAPHTTEEEDALWAKLWKDVPDKGAERNVGAYSMSETEYPQWLEKMGFKKVTVQLFPVMSFAPDSADISPEVAKEMIEAERIGMLEPMKKALAQKPDALTDAEKQRLLEIINSQIDERLRKYEAGEHLWDLASSTILCACGTKAN